jgi:hypothetical protein
MGCDAYHLHERIGQPVEGTISNRLQIISQYICWIKKQRIIKILNAIGSCRPVDTPPGYLMPAIHQGEVNHGN